MCLLCGLQDQDDSATGSVSSAEARDEENREDDQLSPDPLSPTVTKRRKKLTAGPPHPLHVLDVHPPLS